MYEADHHAEIAEEPLTRPTEFDGNRGTFLAAR
jgi:hypothetical protein